jgi:hypothetical protein
MRHSDPAANGYSTSTNFNELHATKMRELDADPAIPRPKRRERVPTPSAPTASGYSTSPNYTAMFNQRMAELRVSKPEIFAPTKPKPRSRRSKTREMDPPA